MGGSGSLCVIALVVASLAGCAGAPFTSTSIGPSSLKNDGPRPIVIAVIDSGLSPYYPVFDATQPGHAAAFVPPGAVDVTFAPPEAGKDPAERDMALWRSLKLGTLYHFTGSRLLGISFDTDRTTPYVLDWNEHGDATSYLAARDAPNATIVVIQFSGKVCGADCLASPTLAQSAQWAADQPWIDIISISQGIPGNLPDRPEAHPEVRAYYDALALAASRGKIVVNAAGNEITPPLTDYFNGPPHIIDVGGFSFNQSGDDVLASKAVDVVANFTDIAPLAGNGELRWRAGTSFSAPIVAGTLANAWDLIHREQPARNVTTRELRDALNASAVMFSAKDWQPLHDGVPSVRGGSENASLPIVAQAQLGWGYVNSSLAPEIARRVLQNDFTIPPGKEQAAIVQPQWQAAREAFWDNYMR